jgi:hypothetical protein
MAYLAISRNESSFPTNRYTTLSPKAQAIIDKASGKPAEPQETPYQSMHWTDNSGEHWANPDQVKAWREETIKMGNAKSSPDTN